MTCHQLGLDQYNLPEVVELNEPAEGIPAVISTQRGLDNALARLSAATGPVAIDTERASGIRYGQRAFLVQLKRGNSGIILIDPEAFDDLTQVNDALRGVEWILHASTQDLPCLRERGMNPDCLFDTELAARLAGFERVGLGATVERLLGYKLAKEHSNVDWSKRPLPADWLNYAALDVEVLIDLREALIEVLQDQGKLEYARQEFAFIAASPDKAKPTDPWRKTKGIHGLRNRRQLTALRNLWYERDKLARKKDVAPKRLLPDPSLIQAARSMPRSVPGVLKIPGFQTRALKREAPRWIKAIASAKSETEPVPYSTPADGPPPLKAWETKKPASSTLIHACKDALNILEDQVNIPHENILTPDYLRRLCWEPPQEPSEYAVSHQLQELGARPWQIEMVVPVLTPIFSDVLG